MSSHKVGERPRSEPVAAADDAGGVGELLQAIEGSLAYAAGRARGTEARLAALEARLSEVERDGRDLAGRLVMAEHQTSRLMSLYVATYQLHATLDPAEVRGTISEIALNLLGAERFVLLLRRERGGQVGCEVAIAMGLEDDVEGLYSEALGYDGGDPMVDATMEDGVLRIGPMEGSSAIAAVPLVVQETTVGALVILKMLAHKPVLLAEDRDLLDLLAAHAASALFAAELHATTDRKLRTLEGLVQLARKG